MLYKRVAQGDEQAFSTAHNIYKARLVYYIRRFQIDWDTIQDIVSDTFLALWQSRAKLQSNDHLRNFLFLTARHRAMNAVDQRNHYGAMIEEINEDTLQVADIATEEVRAEFLYLIHAAVHQLPDEYRKIYRLAFEKEFSPSEIARILNRNPSTIRTQKQRALDMIREWIHRRTLQDGIIAEALIAILFFLEFFLIF